MIRVEGLVRTFGGEAVLRGVDLEVPDGHLLAVIGPSGGGKSVLLRHLVGLLRPDAGRVIVDGLEVGGLGRERLRRLRARFGVLFQGGALFDSLSVFDNVAFPLREKTRFDERAIAARVRAALDEVGLGGAAARLPMELSGGMRKRAALARALILDPAIALFDEPTTGLDPVLLRSILGLIRAAWRRLGFTGVVISHDVPAVFAIADEVALLDGGRIVEAGTPAQIEASRNPTVRRFLSGGAEAEA